MRYEDARKLALNYSLAPKARFFAQSTVGARPHLKGRSPTSLLICYIYPTMFESIILGLLQGLAEFLPISSSGHLVLGHELLGMNEAGMFFDIMLHAGTLLSIFVVFHKKITDIIVGCIRKNPEQLKEAGYIILASIPTALIGLGFKDLLAS